ncbi:phosphotransferase [Flagellimonas lutimaris]|uniref:phosphotransferase n=1 Tax=Flagellimonas lutimaris TaxID=475082 RepID=UPI003F5CE51A
METITTDINTLGDYLCGQGWLKKEERVLAVETPGAGNMNFTLRVRTNQGSFIIKQSRAYVEKYPQVPAPVDRSLREAEFYTLIDQYDILKAQMPKLRGVDKENYVLNLEDLGDGIDYSFLYQKERYLKESELEEIMAFAVNLHSNIHLGTTDIKIPNREMRRLNHEHIFVFPYLQENGLNLDDIIPGLREVGNIFKQDKVLINIVQQLGERYLIDGKTLLHGDYFPGSWLNTSGGIKIIDPEFCFFGEPEFEIGVTLAHLKLAAQPQTIIDKALKFYMDRAPLQKELCFQFMATEVLRRILGLAQLPLSLNVEERHTLLQEAKEILV